MTAADDTHAFNAMRERLDEFQQLEVALAQSDLACDRPSNAERQMILREYFSEVDPQLADIYAGL